MGHSHLWAEQAVLVRSKTDDGTFARHIVAEGTLGEILCQVAGLSTAERSIHVVSLPDRGAPPFRFEGSALNELIARTDRPGWAALMVPVEGIGSALTAGSAGKSARGDALGPKGLEQQQRGTLKLRQP